MKLECFIWYLLRVFLYIFFFCSCALVGALEWKVHRKIEMYNIWWERGECMHFVKDKDKIQLTKFFLWNTKKKCSKFYSSGTAVCVDFFLFFLVPFFILSGFLWQCRNEMTTGNQTPMALQGIKSERPTKWLPVVSISVTKNLFEKQTFFFSSYNFDEKKKRPNNIDKNCAYENKKNERRIVVTM